MVLANKGILFETVNINLKFKPEWFWEKNPLGLVPILEMDDKIVYESTATCEWLDDVYTQTHLQPTDPLRKAWDRMLLEYMGKLIVSIRTFAFISTSSPEEKEKAVVTLHKAYQHYNDVLAQRGGPFFGGESPAMIDLYIWPHMERVPAIANVEPNVAVDKSKYVKLGEWFDAMYDRPEVKATMFDAKSHSYFLDTYKAGNPDYDFGLKE